MSAHSSRIADSSAESAVIMATVITAAAMDVDTIPHMIEQLTDIELDIVHQLGAALSAATRREMLARRGWPVY